MIDMTVEGIVVGAVLPYQAVVKRNGYWDATVELTVVTSIEPSRYLKREGDCWFALVGIATLADGRRMHVESRSSLLSLGTLHATWNRC